MDFNLMPSLEYISVIKIVVSLWDQFEDIKQEMNSSRKVYFENDTSWLDVEEKVIKKVEMLPLPLKMRKKIIPFIKPIGFELMKWIMFLREYISEQHIIRSLNMLHWTQLGKIDRSKTVKLLIRDENIDADMRCELGYVYCFELNLSVLRYKVQSNKFKYFIKSLKKRFKSPHKPNDESLVSYWINVTGIKNKDQVYVSSECGPNSTRYQRAFENAVCHGNKAATEYFFQKLSSEEKRESLSRSIKQVIVNSYTVSNYDHVSYDYPGSSVNSEYIDVFYFLFSQMDEHEQMLVLQRYAFSVLTYFLNWPWQSLFIKTVQYIWPYLCEDEFEDLLCIIVDWAKTDFEIYDYRNLFTNFWNQSPETFKKYVTENFEFNELLFKLFEIEDKENIKLILEGITVIEKKELFFSDVGRDICCAFIKNHDWCSLEFFIQQFMSSENEVAIIKEFILQNIGELDSMNIFKQFVFFQLLRDLIEKKDTKKEVEVQTKFLLLFI